MTSVNTNFIPTLEQFTKPHKSHFRCSNWIETHLTAASICWSFVTSNITGTSSAPIDSALCCNRSASLKSRDPKLVSNALKFHSQPFVLAFVNLKSTNQQKLQILVAARNQRLHPQVLQMNCLPWRRASRDSAERVSDISSIKSNSKLQMTRIVRYPEWDRFPLLGHAK